MYKSFEDVKMENKVTTMPLNIHLSSDPKEAISGVKKISESLRDSYQDAYSSTTMRKFLSYFQPMWHGKMASDRDSLPYTLSFSNLPGVLKSTNIGNTTVESAFNTFVAPGKLAVVLNFISFGSNVQTNWKFVCNS